MLFAYEYVKPKPIELLVNVNLKKGILQNLYTCLSIKILIMLAQLLQISFNPEAWGVWVPLATGLGIGLVYALISAARKSR